MWKHLIDGLLLEGFSKVETKKQATSKHIITIKK